MVGSSRNLLAYPFLVGYSSHLLLDLCNKKGIRICYPLKTTLCLKLCGSNGTCNQALYLLAILMIGIVIGIKLIELN